MQRTYRSSETPVAIQRLTGANRPPWDAHSKFLNKVGIRTKEGNEQFSKVHQGQPAKDRGEAKLATRDELAWTGHDYAELLLHRKGPGDPASSIYRR